jgi:hypothetical protein
MPLRIAGPAAPRCARGMVAFRLREKELLITAMSLSFVGAVLLKDRRNFHKSYTRLNECGRRAPAIRARSAPPGGFAPAEERPALLSARSRGLCHVRRRVQGIPESPVRASLRPSVGRRKIPRCSVPLSRKILRLLLPLLPMAVGELLRWSEAVKLGRLLEG